MPLLKIHPCVLFQVWSLLQFCSGDKTISLAKMPALVVHVLCLLIVPCMKRAHTVYQNPVLWVWVSAGWGKSALPHVHLLTAKKTLKKTTQVLHWYIYSSHLICPFCPGFVVVFFCLRKPGVIVSLHTQKQFVKIPVAPWLIQYLLCLYKASPALLTWRWGWRIQCIN